MSTKAWFSTVASIAVRRGMRSWRKRARTLLVRPGD